VTCRYPDEKLRRLCREAVERGFTHLKIKVGRNLEDDMRRCRIIREEIGPDRALMIDANQVPQRRTLRGARQSAVICTGDMRGGVRGRSGVGCGHGDPVGEGIGALQGAMRYCAVRGIDRIAIEESNRIAVAAVD
jgi:hypothetical protein